MLLESERELVAEYGRKMSRENLVKGTGGNISIFSRKEGLMAISPTGKDYETIGTEDVMVTDLEGKIIEGTTKPSSEYRMHAIFYKKRNDIDAVIHTHSINAAALSCLRMDLPPIYYLTISAGSVVRCAKYALTGSEELAIHAFDAMRDNYAALLANHGVIAGAETIQFAYYIAEQVEFAAELYLKSRTISEPVPLNDREIQDMQEIFEKLRFGGKRKS